jgi:hypothetical protein
MSGAVSGDRYAWQITSAPARGAGQDRAIVVPVVDGLVVALADGAGGTSGGATAADAVIAAATTAAVALVAGSPLGFLVRLDRAAGRLGGGQCTAIVAHVDGAGGIRGASVGDSAAWLVSDRPGEVAIVELTADQARKPLLGGGARATALRPGGLGQATLVIASDGLFAYAARAAIAAIATGPDLAAIGPALVELVRLPSGALPDDVAIVVVRAR